MRWRRATTTCSGSPRVGAEGGDLLERESRHRCCDVCPLLHRSGGSLLRQDATCGFLAWATDFRYLSIRKTDSVVSYVPPPSYRVCSVPWRVNAPVCADCNLLGGNEAHIGLGHVAFFCADSGGPSSCERTATLA